jgi:hypothetical protein
MSKRVALSRHAAWVFLAVVYYLAAGASFSGFFLKWHFHETEPYSLPKMLDGNAPRPFVYRQLLPMSANAIARFVPPVIERKFLDKLAEEPPVSNPIQRYYPTATDAANRPYALRYFLVYAASFLSMVAAMFAIRAACIEVIGDKVAATLTPLVLALFFPLILTEGGYFYDMPELMFMAVGIWLALKRRIIVLAAVTVVATLNKESYLFFVLALVPFIAVHYSRGKTATLASVLLALAASVNIWMKLRYAANSGGSAQYQLLSHLEYLIDPRNYFRMEMNYGILTTKGFNVIHLLLVVLLLKNSWRTLPPVVRSHAWIALSINVPLFIAFCYKDELRNLSLLAMTLAFLICATISSALQQAAAQSHTDRSDHASLPARADRTVSEGQ